ncbi:flagellar basal body L-ring protein FlgH [Aliikangiella sp. IMCC44632]
MYRLLDKVKSGAKQVKLVSYFFILLSLSGCTTVYQNANAGDPEWAPAYPAMSDTSQSNPGAIYNPSSNQMLFQDKKALRVGDIITIVLTENTNASKNADTEVAKDSSTELSAPSIFGNVLSVGGGMADLSVSSGGQARSFKAEADSAQSNKLSGTITVTVHQVYPNGNLMIKGEKWISLNQGSEFIRVAGLIRPEDIDKDNQIQSTKIANARIYYGGKGVLAEANESGWLTRFFNTGWWPF